MFGLPTPLEEIRMNIHNFVICCDPQTGEALPQLPVTARPFVAPLNTSQSHAHIINSFGQIQKHIADSYAEYMAGKAYVYALSNSLALDSAGNRLDSDGVKLYASVMGKNVADRAIQVLGGYGYVGEYHVERLWRDAKLLEIGGGTLEAHQKNMTRELSNSDRLA